MWTHFKQTRGRTTFLTLALAVASVLPALAQDPIPAAGMAQIQAFIQEKANRTPAQQKLDSQIIYNSKMSQGQSITAGISATFTPGALESVKGLIHVDISANVSPALLNAITAMGGRVESSFPQSNAVRAWIPLSVAETLASRADVRFVRPAELSQNNGPILPHPVRSTRQAGILAQLGRALPAFATTERSVQGGSILNVGPDTSGVKAHGADIVQAAGVIGTGVKIGVLSNGVTSLATEQAAGRLPASVTVIPGQSGVPAVPGACPGSNCPDEGTAMLEIVYSMAPGAQLFFATANPSQAQFAANIMALQAAGCNVIVDDVTYFREPVFQDGTVAQAVNAVTALGVLYFSSSANSGNLDSNTSGTWEGDFSADGPAPAITEVGVVHNFGGQDYNILTQNGSIYLLQWSDPFGASGNDYDLFILNPAGTAVEAASTNSQTGTQDPFESIGNSAGIALNSRIVIVKFSGAARALHLDTERGRLSIGTAGNTFGHNAAANTLTVAAVDVATASGGIFVGGTTNPVEFFSSDGPRKIFYDPTGAPITPGNLLFGTNGGTTLSKVDFTAANGVPTGVPGFTSFFGTSAAAPHAAAIAALIKSANPGLTSAQIKTIMVNTSLPVSNFLARTKGSGIVMANLGVAAANPPDLTIAKSHSGNFSQGQTGATYAITVTNSGTGPTTGTVTVVDTLPAGLTATAMTGSGWTCTVATLTCTSTTVEAGATAFPAITLTVNVAANAAASVINTATVSGGGETNTNNDTANDSTTITPVIALIPDLTITKSHAGNFSQGQTGATYTITVTNSGTGQTGGTVTVVDTLPVGLTATALSGSGWTCTLATLTCTSSTVEAAAASFPAITLTVNVAANAAASVTNTATVSGGGETNTGNDIANNLTTITPVNAQTPDLTIGKSHTGNFSQGQTGATYTITVTNSGTGPTTGTVTVVDTLPAGLTATAMTGSGWTCTLATLTCTSTTVEAAAASFPVITLTVNVAANAASSIINTAVVSGGGETNTSNDTANDSTIVTAVTPAAPDLTITKTHAGNFIQGQIGATYSITAVNAGTGPTAGTVTVVDTLPSGLTATAMTGSGWTCTVATLTCTSTTVEAAGMSFPVITLTVNVAPNAVSGINSATVSGGGETNLNNDTANDPTTIDPAVQPSALSDIFQVRYAANLNIGDSFIDITNTGASGGANLCANLYTFDPAEELISCCTCSVTPNGLQSLSVLKSLISNPLTPAIPTAVVVKMVATTGACNASVVNPANLAHGLAAWGTTLHQNTSAAASSYSVSETSFSKADLSPAELAHITSTCGFIQSNGSGFGICKGCAASGLGATSAQ